MDVVEEVYISENITNRSGKKNIIQLIHPYQENNNNYNYNYNYNYGNNYGKYKKPHTNPYYLSLQFGDEAVFSDTQIQNKENPYIMFTLQNPIFKGVYSIYGNSVDQANLYFYLKPVGFQNGKRVHKLEVKFFDFENPSNFRYPNTYNLQNNVFNEVITFLKKKVRKTEEASFNTRLNVIPKNVQNIVGSYLVGSRRKRKQTRKNRRTNRKTRRSY